VPGWLILLILREGEKGWRGGLREGERQTERRRRQACAVGSALGGADHRLTPTRPPSDVGPSGPSRSTAMSVATPNLDHLTKADYEVVYDPAGASAAGRLRASSSSPGRRLAWQLG
jgi:hypothetical protein